MPWHIRETLGKERERQCCHRRQLPPRDRSPRCSVACALKRRKEKKKGSANSSGLNRYSNGGENISFAVYLSFYSLENNHVQLKLGCQQPLHQPIDPAT